MGSTAWLLGLFLTVLAGPLVGHAAALPAAAGPPELPGLYDCQGTGADGRPYRGAVVIQPDGSRFLLQWYVATELTAVGVGIREGNMLAVSFYSADAGGVVLYRIDGDKLVGRWSAPLTNGQVFEEILTRAANQPAPPEAAPSKPPTTPRPSRTRPFGGSLPITWTEPNPANRSR